MAESAPSPIIPMAKRDIAGCCSRIISIPSLNVSDRLSATTLLSAFTQFHQLVLKKWTMLMLRCGLVLWVEPFSNCLLDQVEDRAKDHQFIRTRPEPSAAASDSDKLALSGTVQCDPRWPAQCWYQAARLQRFCSSIWNF